ncbi:hypothetical protein ACQKNX_04710 [Lysinibacillus sp. NPDC093712]|uniref:hypothetical protein n=1 Tax=Lysinibacillus sp. NPDC093712 TaxID=3390579 RepID=UPI003CFCD1C8
MQKLIKLTLRKSQKLYDEIGMITGTNIYNKELLIDTDLSIKRITFDMIQNASLVDIDD